MKKKERLRIKRWTENNSEWINTSKDAKIGFVKYFITHSKQNLKRKDKSYITKLLVKSTEN